MQLNFTIESLYIVIAIVAIIIIYFLRRQSRKIITNPSYSIWEILNPFNTSALWQIYRHLSPENKGAFFSVISSIIIGVLTGWLGFSIQYFVYNSSQTESEKLSHYQIVDKFRTTVLQLTEDSCSAPFFEKMVEALGYESNNQQLSKEDLAYYVQYNDFPIEKKETPSAIIFSYMNDSINWPSISYTAKKIIQVSSEFAPYLNSKESSEILNNNAQILGVVQVYDLLNDSIEYDSVKFVNHCINQQIKESVKMQVSLQGNFREIFAHGYSFYKLLKTHQKHQKDLSDAEVAYAFNQAVMKMFKNLKMIYSCFSPIKIDYWSSWQISLFVLFLGIFIGYLILRWISMTYFDPNSMKPNPQLSQVEYEKHTRRMKNLKNENDQYKTNNISLQNSIELLNNKLKESELQSANLEKELERKKNSWKEEERKLKDELLLLQNQINELVKMTRR